VLLVLAILVYSTASDSGGAINIAGGLGKVNTGSAVNIKGGNSLNSGDGASVLVTSGESENQAGGDLLVLEVDCLKCHKAEKLVLLHQILHKTLVPFLWLVK
jgi:hypothetical protein